MSKTLAEWLDYQSQLHPKGIALGLERVSQVWQALGAPAPAQHVITVAGTNGKGSSVAFLEHILGAAGYRTGGYTSPHLLHYNERIRINGDPVTDAQLCDAFEQIEQARGNTALTYFEYGTLAALWCMARASLDVAVLEVGLGGRLDAVNIIDADVALITGIALEHTDWLGNSVEQIGAEKAGIARAGRPLVFASPEMPDAIADAADEVGARLYRLGSDYDYQLGKDGWQWQLGETVRAGLPWPGMRGRIQIRNAAGALAVLQLLPDLPVEQRAIREGLLRARVAGRFDVRQRRCRWILDVAHNPQAARVLAGQLADIHVPGIRHAVVGMLGDKAIREVLAILAPLVDRWHILDLSAEARGASALELKACLAEPARAHAMMYDTVDGCLSRLDVETTEQDQVLVFGSFVTVGKVMAWLQEQTITV